MEVQKENKMGTMPINRLLVNMSLPMVVSMLVQALYNIVDSVFVAQIDEYALTAVSLAFPLQNFMIAVGAGTGVGVNALLSRRLGERRYKEANKAADNSIFLAFASYLLFLIIGLTMSEIYFKMQTDIPEIIAYGKTYLIICLVCSFGMFGQFCFERLLQSTGRTVCTMITQSTGAVINIIFDPILIFGLFGFPRMGIAGAAIATVFGQIVAMLFSFILNLKQNVDIKISFRGVVHPDRKTVKEIYEVGIPSILMQSIGSVMTFFMNKVLMNFNSTATAVFGVYFKLQSFIFMPVFGINNGLIPIVAYNYGAAKKERILKAMKSSMIVAVGFMAAGLLAAELIPGELLKMFNASENMLKIGIPALRILSLSYVFAGFSIIASGLFQGLGKSVYSLVLSVIRQLVILIPTAYLLSLTGNLTAVWFSFPIAEIVAIIITIFYLRRIRQGLDGMIAARK